jgi:hypothetical protein
MEIEIDFYTEDPFEKEASFRLQGITARTEDFVIYELFVKNMIAFVFYQTDIYHEDSGLIDYEGNQRKIDQDYLYKKYISGKLKTGFIFDDYRSPLTAYCLEEFHILKQDTSVEACRYIEFIRDHYEVFRRIDVLVDVTPRYHLSGDFAVYLKKYGLDLPHVNVSEIFDKMDDYFTSVCKDLACSYIYHFNESFLYPDDYHKELVRLYISMKYDLLEPDEQNKLVLYCTRWITQCFKSFAFEHQLVYAVNEMEGDFIFEPILQKFIDYFSFGSQKVVAEKSYPTPIFASYEVYQLFHTLAQGLSIKVSVSFVYRFLHEKGLILVKDAPFREWYNQQSYPLTFQTATETLANSKSSEREQFVGIVAKLIGVTL